MSKPAAVPMGALLRRVLVVDALLSGVTAAALLVDAVPLAVGFGLPEWLLRLVGALLVPWVGGLLWLAFRPRVVPLAIFAVIGLNAAWALDCALAALGSFGATPLGWGSAVLVVQCLGTLAIAELEWVGLRRASRAAEVPTGPTEPTAATVWAR